MVYGFAKQSGGHVDIVSSPGAGTEIRLWLPCSSETPQAVQAPVVALPTGHETILVVEDEPAVRASVVGLIEALGYRVETATDGEDALARLQTGLPVDLLFTDVVMPGRISGIELARRTRMLRPDLPILFTSGFAQDALEQDAAAGEPIALLAKPYRRDELARRLREALDRTNAPRRSLRVLLVEDQADSRITTQALLRALGHQPHAVATAAEALAALAHGAWDVLLTDLHLVGASGAELAAKVRARWPRMRIVLASGATRAMLDAADADARLQKPYGIEALQQALGMVPAPVATGPMG
jgi:CheY-like chemotaxis protein